MPFVLLELPEGDSDGSAIALHSVPSLVAHGNQRDQWWSLGAIQRNGVTELTLLSGPCAVNGRNGVVKARQREFVPYPDTFVNVPPGTIIEKRFYLQAYGNVARGQGFRKAVRESIGLFAPFDCGDMPLYDRIVQDKYRFAKTRWYVGPKSAGFRMYPGDKKSYVMGWCGQAAAPGYALIVMADRLDRDASLRMAQRSLDHLAKSPFNEMGFCVRYNPNNDSWQGQDPVSQGQAMENFSRAILAGRKHATMDTATWETFLKQACDVHANRILADSWRPQSTNEGFFVSPLCKAFTLFGKEAYRQAAIKAGEHYAERHLSMDEPYWGGTLDASCEDKEGAWAGFQAFLALYELTGNDRYLRWAEHACDVVLSYTVVWDIQMPPGRLQDMGFRTRGWTDVSAQNQHLDVYGVIMTPQIYRLGELTGREDIKQLAKLMYRSCGQLIDPYGSQGEQIQHTNFAQRGDMSDIYKMRGGYAEGWTVFWITAHFLNAAAQFEEMDISL